MPITEQSVHRAQLNIAQSCVFVRGNSWSVLFGHRSLSSQQEKVIQPRAVRQPYFSQLQTPFVGKFRPPITWILLSPGSRVFLKIQRNSQREIVHSTVFSIFFDILIEKPYPREFERTLIRPIFTLLYYILAHIYEFHFEAITDLGEESQLNAVFCHFMAFSKEFGLLQGIDLEPLDSLYRKYFPKGASSSDANSDGGLAVRQSSEENVSGSLSLESLAIALASPKAESR